MDADTCLALVDLGFGRYEYVEIRLLDYSSPESDTPQGEAATAYANLIAPPGTRALLRSSPRTGKLTPTFSRWTAQVEIEDLGDYATTLAAAGHARKGSFVG